MTQKYPLLNQISDPKDVKKLTGEQCEQLASEIREFLVESVSHTGGHLASNLGVVEMTIVLHRIFDSPQDKFLFDVGHQSYVHKILTGRKDGFDSLRTNGGLSGFPNPEESVHDVLKMGHSSTSLSAGLGICAANNAAGNSDYVIVVVGDGAMTGGMSFEAIENVRNIGGKLIVVLNDNKMSISKNVGALARYLSKIRAKPRYFRLKDQTESFLNRIPLIGKAMHRLISKIKKTIKYTVYRENFFEGMGLTYLGPVDGHDFAELSASLQRAKDLGKPVLVHVQTKKGKGYSYAEESPSEFHGVSTFDVDTGLSKKASGDSYSDKFGQLICNEASENKNIHVITAAMCEGCCLSQFAKEYPRRFYDVGIAEEHAVTFSAGLARGGMLPVFAVYASFFQRAYDQIIHDISLQKLKVIFAVDRCGIVGADGETHQGLFDVPMLLPIPNLTVFSPSTYSEMSAQFRYLCDECDTAGVLRYPRGAEPLIELPIPQNAQPYQLIGENSDMVVVTYGREIFPVWTALESMQKKPSLLKINQIKPFSQQMLLTLQQYKKILIVEEGYLQGGVGTALQQQLMQLGFAGKTKIHAIDNGFVKHASYEEILVAYGLDALGVTKVIKEFQNE